jgi:ParB/RepB/Spo0J family partition protein
MTKLNILAVQNADVLRALRTGDHVDIKALADALDKVPSNLKRSLGSLSTDMLIDWAGPDTMPMLSDEGRDALAAIDRAEGDAPSIIGSQGGVLHAQILPSSLNPRRDWDSDDAKEALAELAESIAADGLLQNLVVRADAKTEGWVRFRDQSGALLPLYELVAGERRFRAISRLIADGRWPEDQPIPVKIVDLDAAGHARVALIENLKRKDLKPLEEARAFAALRLGDAPMTTAEIAEAINSTQRLVQQRLQLLELSEADQDLLDRGLLTIEQARQKIANKPRPIEVGDAQVLVFLETAHLVATRGKGAYYYDLVVGSQIDDMAGIEGDAAHWLTHRWATLRENWKTGLSEIRLTYASHDLIEQLTGRREFKVSTVEPALRRARLKMLAQLDERANPLSAKYVSPETILAELTAQGRYLTPWLNGPFHIHPSRIAAHEERKQAEREQDERLKVARAAEEEAKQRQREAAETLKVIAASFHDDRPASIEAVSQSLESFGHPLPWKFKPASGQYGQDNLLDANGEEIDLYNADALLPLLMAAMNHAVGLPPEMLEADPDEEEEASEDDDLDDEVATGAATEEDDE